MKYKSKKKYMQDGGIMDNNYDGYGNYQGVGSVSYNGNPVGNYSTQPKEQKSSGSGNNYGKYSGYAEIGASALGSAYGISQSNANGDYKANMYKNAANQTGNAVVSKAVPVMGPIIGAKDTIVGAIAKGTNTSNINPETGETTYKKGWAATGAGLAQPTHTRQISQITDAVQNPNDYGKVAMANLSVASPGIDMAVEAAQNMWGKDKYGESQEIIDKNNKTQQDQQNDYNNMMNFYKSQQANQMKFGGNLNSQMTEYNGGFKHSDNNPENKNSGIPIGKNSVVERNEVRGSKTVGNTNKKSKTADYIFSNSLYIK